MQKLASAPSRHRKAAIFVVKLLMSAFSIVVFGGCAATQVTTHAVGNTMSSTSAMATKQTALILWGTAWRTNQKEVALREGMAGRGITQYFSTAPCFSKVEILKSAAGREAVGMSDVEALNFAAAAGKEYGLIILVRVEELGPLIMIHPSPVLWEGGTEVALRVRVLNTRTAALETDTAIHWRNSGPFVLKGTRTLEQDIQAALASVFRPTPGAAK